MESYFKGLCIMNQKNFLKGYALVILSALIFGLMPLMAKFIYREGITPQSLVLLRTGLATPFLLVLSVLTKGKLKLAPRAVPSVALIALMGCALTPLLLFSSYNYMPSGAATVLHFIYPAAVVIGELLFLRKKLSKGQLISIALCVIGIAMFYNPENKLDLTGSLIAILSGITYAAYIILLSGFKHKDISGFAFSFWVSAFSAILMLVFCLATNSLTLPQTAGGWLLTILFAVSLNVGAVVLFQKGTFIIGGSRSAVLSTFEPVTSVLAGIIFFNESAGVFTVVGTVLVLTASILIAMADMKK